MPKSLVSQRRFIQLFRDEIGLAPILFRRVQRFQEVIRMIGTRATVDWLEITLAHGYYDQAHFIHDFQEFSSLPLASIFNYARRILVTSWLAGSISFLQYAQLSFPYSSRCITKNRLSRGKATMSEVKPIPDSAVRVWQRLCQLLWALPKLPALCAIVTGMAVAVPGESRRERITKLVVLIQRADYEGDPAAPKQLYNDLRPFADDKEFGAKVRYWRGFALWRRALNGSNDNAAPSELEQDLKLAASEFEAAIIRDAAFVDARAAAGATRGFLMALYRTNPALAHEFDDPARMQESIDKALSYMREAEAAKPGNPRVLWVLGPVHFYLSHGVETGRIRLLMRLLRCTRKD
jgi:hypothetical protein